MKMQDVDLKKVSPMMRHYISVKEWDKWNKHEVCCKCNIF